MVWKLFRYLETRRSGSLTDRRRDRQKKPP